MKLRANQIIVGVVVLLCALFAFVLWSARSSDATRKTSGSVEEDFLADARRQAESAPAGEEVGLQPGEGTPKDRVPVIQLQSTYDMGVIAHDKLTEGAVMVFNKGTYDLTVTSVTTSCACTIGNMRQKTIPPGGHAPLDVVVDPRRIGDFQSDKVLTVTSNDPKNPEVEMTVLTQVDPEFTLEPRHVEFGTVQKGQTAKAQVIVRQKDDKPLKIEKVEPWGSGTSLAVTVEPRPEAQWAQPGKTEYAINLTLDTTDLPPGPFKNAGYALYTNVERFRILETGKPGALTSKVTAEIATPYTLAPRPVSLGSVPPGQADAGTITVTASSPVEISQAEVSGQGIVASVKPAAGNEAAVALSVAPDAMPGVRQEDVSLTFKIGDQVFHEKVRVTAVVAAPSGSTASAAATTQPAAVAASAN